MNNTSLAYKEGRYADIFDAARSNRLRVKDIVDYSKSREKLRDIQKGIKYAAEEAAAEASEKAHAQGLAEGRAEGRAEERIKSIRLMLSFGVSADQIAEKYGMSADEVHRIGESD